LKHSLYLLFSTYGHIIDVVALKTPKMRGQAHVAFSDLTSATLALKALHDFNFFGKNMEISYAKTKSDAIAKLDGSYKMPPPPSLDQSALPLAPFDQSNQPQKRPRDDDDDNDDE
jgi:U2 small nuclear ribonucleoprotein B''